MVYCSYFLWILHLKNNKWKQGKLSEVPCQYSHTDSEGQMLYFCSSIPAPTHISNSQSLRCQFIARKMKIIMSSCLGHYIQFRSCNSEKDVLKLEYVQRIEIYACCSLDVSTGEGKVLFKVRKVLLAEEQMDRNCL